MYYEINKNKTLLAGQPLLEYANLIEYVERDVSN